MVYIHCNSSNEQCFLAGRGVYTTVLALTLDSLCLCLVKSCL